MDCTYHITANKKPSMLINIAKFCRYSKRNQANDSIYIKLKRATRFVLKIQNLRDTCVNGKLKIGERMESHMST